MNSEKFITVIKQVVRDAAIEDVIANIENPPGRKVTASEKAISNWFNQLSDGDKNKVKRQHPAAFPDKIPYDFIQVFTEENDIILDPMTGSGSTCVAAKLLNRQYIGIDISEEYCSIAQDRVDNLETALPNHNSIEKVGVKKHDWF